MSICEFEILTVMIMKCSIMVEIITYFVINSRISASSVLLFKTVSVPKICLVVTYKTLQICLVVTYKTLQICLGFAYSVKGISPDRWLRNLSSRCVFTSGFVIKKISKYSSFRIIPSET